MRIALRISYLGRRFSGSQQQPDTRTVEGVLIETCLRLGLFEDFRSAGFVSAGRTDAGVSARKQMVAFTTPYPERAVSSLNRMLPYDCQATGWAEVPDDFNPRYQAKSRTYRYLFPEEGLDLQLMEEAASRFVGLHDFRRIARVEEGRDPMRRILSAGIFRDEDLIVFEVSGESFLWNMVRGMATLLCAAGAGVIPPERISTLLTEEGDRIPAAPPDPLVLWDVDCGLTFNPLMRSEKADQLLRNEADRLRIGEKMVGWLGGDRRDLFWNEEIHDELGHLL
ncbi:MAG: tRNA pseudouridine synthase A [Methanomicrobiales archaeon 53_19]|uniref:tRNA pseudouridine(38-40) synthase TruA n=1 Tax=Methanocalculus sp. TaxID=2004547 RepID=UPI00074785FF|nr:tRNA pseudouridine(38-40) synthase TruA [Methanocalculus sp.]KUK68975.1 MAG: tRNA pseudouridine synthase A [Methanocalculus sp. 52_23]KUL01618.1 MAG: tRNA pseudouridine synthase A [Methanomicrobiales archaeon 53_19]HIJ07106.1 tRNA pseudouridine(38-40) synthase TruA [Methanocalculus sp.]